MSLTVKEMRKELSHIINHVEHLSIKDVRYRYYKLIKPKKMREIKFRAWDKNIEHMIYSGVGFEIKCLEYPCKYGKNNEFGSDTIGFININDNYFDIQQYTGLKDKNSKEIYEGDLFLICNEYKEVIFRDGCYFIGHLVLSLSCNHREIIGNIYENKELLNNLKDENN